jgi:putative transposase
LVIEQLPENDKVVGVDFGIKTLAVDSDGKEYANIKPYRTLRKKIKRVQRKLSHRRHKTTNKKSKRIEKVRIQLAKLHQRVKDVRSNHLHQITRKLIDENQVIVVETLAVKNMMKNHSLAGAIADCAWSELLRQLEYKAAWYGRTIVKIDRFFPSSKTCSGCGFIKQDLKLGERHWVCPSCGVEHDRDVNAAQMIRKQGLVQLRVERPEVKPMDSGTNRPNVRSAEVEVGNLSL